MSEVKNIPKHWQVKKLGEVSKVKGGKRLPLGDTYSSEITNFPYIRVTDFENQTINIGKLKFLKESTQKAIQNYIISKNDVYISIAGTIGVTGTIPINLDGANLTENAAKITDIINCNNKFISLFLSSIDGQSQIKDFTKTTTQPKLSLYRIDQIEIPVPPLLEQETIVAKIEELLSDLDNGKQQLQIAQQQLKVYRQSLLKWAFEGKITNKNVKEGEKPEGWKWVKLMEGSNLITKGASPKWQGINYVEDTSQVLFVTSENVRDNYLDVSKPKYLEVSFNEKQKRSVIQKGDILLNIVGASIGRAAIFNLDVVANINQAVAVIRLKKDLNEKFVSYFLNSSEAKSYYNLNKVDFARANLSLADVSNIILPLPNLVEQQNIVDELESKLTVCDRIEETISLSLLQAETLRQSILKKAFEGKLV